ncbi:MAG: hypothetical protein GY853_01675 [PVC group bacterium]|nr:hypothetical protein [PVC group bacterium]
MANSGIKTIEERFLEEKEKKKSEGCIADDAQGCLICGCPTYTNIKVCAPCFQRYRDIFM